MYRNNKRLGSSFAGLKTGSNLPRDIAIGFFAFVLFQPVTVFAEGQPDASLCTAEPIGLETSDRPVCSAVEHLQIALQKIQGLREDEEGHKAHALKAAQSALDETQSYVSPMVMAMPETTSEPEESK